jgi:hypothetical protein
MRVAAALDERGALTGDELSALVREPISATLEWIVYLLVGPTTIHANPEKM